jgi:hypothetical protein
LEEEVGESGPSLSDYHYLRAEVELLRETVAKLVKGLDDKAKVTENGSK